MFISKHKDAFGVEPVCRVLSGSGWQIAPGTYYAAVRRPPPARAVRDAQILAGITQMRAEYEEVYGARKTWLELNRRGIPVARCTVERVMRENGLRGARRGRKIRTTIPGKGPGHERAADLIGRDFTAPAPDRRWVADFTQVATLAGTVYVAFVVDIFSRLFTGWAAARHKRAKLVLDALDMALWHRDHGGHRVSAGLIHHSDAGSQYTSIAFTAHLAAEGIVPSIGSVGDALDNALMESAIGLYKTELINWRGPWRDLAHVEMETAGYLHWFNNRRIHSAIGDVTPAEREAAWYAARGREEEEEEEEEEEKKKRRRRRMKGGGMRRPDFPEEAAALGCGRRDGTGPPPPASTVLRIALARDGLRPPLTPETSGGPQGQQSGAAQRAAPVRPRRPSRPHAAGRWPGLTPGTKRRDTGTRQPPPGHKRTLVRLRQQAEKLQG